MSDNPYDFEYLGKHFAVGSWAIWRVLPHEPLFSQFFAGQAPREEYLLSGTIREITETHVLIELSPWYGESITVQYHKQDLYYRMGYSHMRSELKQDLDALHKRQKEAKKVLSRERALRALEDRTPYSGYGIECEEVVLYVGIAKNIHKRFAQHKRKDPWLIDMIQAGKVVTCKEIFVAIGVLAAREQERAWIAHYDAISRLYNKNSRQKEPQRKLTWKTLPQYMQEQGIPESEYQKTLFKLDFGLLPEYF